MFIIIILRFTRIFSEKDVKNMKIEKVNDNQIRCTLTREDLEDRHIKISELAYGSAKAKSLFKDMVEQANYEFGFETNDIPLMGRKASVPKRCSSDIHISMPSPKDSNVKSLYVIYFSIFSGLKCH